MSDKILDILGPGRAIKLVDNGDGTNSISVSDIGGGTVAVSSIPRSTLNQVVTISVTPVISTGIYAIGDSIGSLFAFDFTTVAGYVAGLWRGAVIRALRVFDDDNEKAGCTLYLFKSAPTTVADNAAWAPSYADLKKFSSRVAIATGDYTTVNSNAFVLQEALDIHLGVSSTVMYGILVATGTPTFSAVSDLTIEIDAITL